jgi:hypothetical protein
MPWRERGLGPYRGGLPPPHGERRGAGDSVHLLGACIRAWVGARQQHPRRCRIDPTDAVLCAHGRMRPFAPVPGRQRCGHPGTGRRRLLDGVQRADASVLVSLPSHAAAPYWHPGTVRRRQLDGAPKEDSSAAGVPAPLCRARQAAGKELGPAAAGDEWPIK